MLSLNDGKLAVKFARNTIENYLDSHIEKLILNLSPIFDEKRGVFVTLTKHNMLRGCIGFPYQEFMLKAAILDASISAATQDPRFSPVTIDEMQDIEVEVTVLTSPIKIDVAPKDFPELVEIGRHGLIVKQGYKQGLLLPQVAPENNMDAIEFLNHTCLKAGLQPNAWLKGAEVYFFEGQIFSETSPAGEIIEKKF